LPSANTCTLDVVGIGHRAFDIDIDRDHEAVLGDLGHVELDLAAFEFLVAIQLLDFGGDRLFIGQR
jgi:hypothetical protein